MVIIQRSLQSLFAGKYPHVEFVPEKIDYLATNHLYFSGANVGALDSKKYTPLMEAAAWKNDELFMKMVEEDSAAVEKTLFHAAKLPDPNTIRVSKLL